MVALQSAGLIGSVVEGRLSQENPKPQYVVMAVTARDTEFAAGPEIMLLCQTANNELIKFKSEDVRIVKQVGDKD